ncbi:NitT/TauT family transport system substrate-binding protein [Paenalcaligenes hominis]|uniref:Thiamine pyrimidine synthase n=1 Tax=Paenalcaligenes hominis TaxID=643674 RepID=A0ABX0WQN3_9BURK|nr:ABC transporter substrate-binding protein [Paenalcaligenes hominis]NJB64875.1 NitT/TauT family transport system substrate-binding protein [Paenalcaligenes hominis]GGE58334.1 putative thiamine biosynthesis protein [Paenalcaligenes hominis]
MIVKRFFLRQVAGLALGTSLALSGSLAWAQHATERFTLAGWSKPISEITQIIAEPELKHFNEQGLDLAYLPGAGGGDALRNLLSGQADIAFTDPGSFFAALDQGAELIAVYDIYPQNVFNVVSLNSSPIKQAEDLKGKKIGVYSLASGTRQNLQILLHQVGLKESDVEIIVTGLLNFAPLMQGQVDATAATDTGLLVAQYRGLKDPQVIEVKDYLNYSSDLFVVRAKDVAERKEAIQQFLQAYKNSTEWMIQHPDQAAQLAVKYAIDGQDSKLNQQIIEARNRSSESELTQRDGLGTLDVSSLQKAADTYFELGLIKSPLDMQQYVSTELVP